MKRSLLVIISVLMTLMAFSSPRKKAKSPKISGLYELISMKEGNNLKKNYIVSTEINLMEKEHTFSAFVGCNRINGELKILSKNRISTKNVSMTKMACQGNTENIFLENLSNVNQYRLNGDQLHLMNGQTVLIILKRKESKQTPLSNTPPQGKYKLKKIWDGSKLASGKYDKAYITFEKGRLSASVGCNGIGGDFQTEGNKILPLKLIMTEMFCEKYNVLEQQFVNALNEVDAFNITGNQLELLSKGIVKLVCEKE